MPPDTREPGADGPRCYLHHGPEEVFITYPTALDVAKVAGTGLGGCSRSALRWRRAGAHRGRGTPPRLAKRFYIRIVEQPGGKQPDTIAAADYARCSPCPRRSTNARCVLHQAFFLS